MHFHLPKPLHGWRQFAGEVGIITVGVLIALAFEAMVDDLKWRGKVGEARTELRHEVGHNFALIDERISEGKCVEGRLNQIAVIITHATASRRLPPVGPISSVGVATWPTSVWESQIAAETMTHFPAEQAAALSRVYRFIGLIRETNRAEGDAWLKLHTIVGPGRPIDAASLSQLIEAMNVARHANASFDFPKQAMEKILVNGGMGRDFPQLDPKNPPVTTKDRPLCDPIGKPPATY